MSDVLGLYKVQLLNENGKVIFTRKVIDWNRREAIHSLLWGDYELPKFHTYDGHRIRDAKEDEKQGVITEKNDKKRKI